MAGKRKDPYDVGYGRPPTRTQFKKGESGNPKGRPSKQDPSAASITNILDELIPVRQGRSQRSMSSFEVGLRRLVGRALRDRDPRAMREFVQLCEKYEVIKPAPPAGPGGGVLYVPDDWDWDEWINMLKRYGPPPWPGKRSGLVEAKTDGIDPVGQT